MNFGWLRPALIKSGHWFTRNAPHILMGLGTSGSIAAVIYTAKATPIAKRLIAEAVVKKKVPTNVEGIDEYVPLTKWETVKAAAPAYGPPAAMELFSLICFWAAHGIDVRRQAILAGVCSAMETTLQEYQRKVAEMIGDKPEKEIRNAIAQDHIDRDPPPSMIFDSNADNWTYYKGYKFRSSYNKLKSIQNEANAEMIRNLYLSENDLLWMFDPERRYIIPDKDSRLVGFTVDRLMEFDILPTFTPEHEPAMEVCIRDEDGRDYYPRPGFSASL